MKPDAILKIAGSPSGLFLVIGLGLFGWGAYKGPFSMQNAMMAWSLPALSTSFAWHYLAHCRHDLFDGQRTLHDWHRTNLVLGMAFLVLAVYLVWKAVTGWT